MSGLRVQFKRSTWIAWVVVIASGVTLAIVRWAWWDFYINFRGSFGPFAIVVAGFFCGLVTVCAIVLLMIAAWLYRTTRNLLFSGLLVCAVVSAFLVPLPPPRPTPEEMLFYERRTDFEQVIELARLGELERAVPECRAGYRLPIKYRDLSPTCVFIDTSEGTLSRITFQPRGRDFIDDIVYVQQANMHSCAGGFVNRRMDEHWGTCEDDWP